MKFVIALVSYLESLGYDTSSLRKSADGSKAIVHMQYAEILSKNLDTNANITIYDRVNPDFQALLASDEWNGNVTGTPNSFGDLAELAKYEARLTAQVTEAKTDMNNFQIEIAGEVTTAKEDLNAIVDNYQVTVNQQLDQKAEQVDLEQLQINKRDKSIKIPLDDFGADALEAIAGNTTLNVLSIPTDKSVNEHKMQFTTIGKNLFDKDTALQGKYIVSTNGTIGSNAIWYASDFIPISPNTQYTVSHANVNNAYYDASKNYISAGASTGTFTTPSTAAYIRVSVSSAYYETFQLELGGVATPFEKYNYSIKKLRVKSENIDPAMDITDMLSDKGITTEKYGDLSIPFNAFSDSTKKILGSFKNNWFGVYAKSGLSSLLYVDGVFDVSAFNDGLTHAVKVTGDLYCDDVRVKNARTVIFVNESNIVTDYLGARFDSSYYAFKQKEIVPFDVDLSVVINANYFHHSLAFSLANNADFAGVFFRNLKITVDGVTIARISNFAPINSAEGSFVAENCFIVAQADDMAPLRTDVETLKATQNLKWVGKTWNVLGDSITAGGGVKYFSLIASKYGMTVNNYGVSGTGYSFRDGYDNSTSISNRYADMTNDADLITVFAGTNDFAVSNLPLGQLGDVTQTTVYGCIDYTFNGLIEKYPTKLIGVILPLQRQGTMINSKGETLKQYVDAIRQVAQKYSLPVLDLFNESSIYPNNDTARATYIPDGLHPNEAGHTRLSDKFLAFINTL